MAAKKQKITRTAETKQEPELSTLVIPRMEINEITVRLRGTTPLLVNAWSEKAKEQMRRKQQKLPAHAKKAKDPRADFLGCLYWVSKRPTTKKVTDAQINRATFGVPAVWFKANMVRACKQVDGLAMVDAKSIMFVREEARDPMHPVYGLVPIESGPPVCLEHPVRVGMGTADLRYRPLFQEWSIKITVEFNARMISKESVVNLLQISGWGIGIGEWRPGAPKSLTGTLGRYDVESA